MRVMPVAATAPPMIGPQAIAVCEDSTGVTPVLLVKDITIPIVKR
jgi:hypothetical protein